MFNCHIKCSCWSLKDTVIWLPNRGWKKQVWPMFWANEYNSSNQALEMVIWYMSDRLKSKFVNKNLFKLFNSSIKWSFNHRKTKAPGSPVGKRQVWLVFSAAGQEWAGGSISEQTRWGGAMSAAKFDLPLESDGPSSQESSSSSHHSDVSKVVVSSCPPTARSRGCVDPTGIIWK